MIIYILYKQEVFNIKLLIYVVKKNYTLKTSSLIALIKKNKTEENKIIMVYVKNIFKPETDILNFLFLYRNKMVETTKNLKFLNIMRI